MARISLVHGDVSTQRGDSGDWSAATLNTPMAPGDKISTGNKGRAEVQLDFADVLRIADSSQATITALQRTQIQIQLGEGLAYFSMFKGHEADVEIDTPNVAIHPIGKDGAYRIYVNPGGQTEVSVRNGEAEITTPQGSTRVKRGDLITIQGDSNNAQYKITGATGRDDWDAFNEDRDRQIQKADAWRHTGKYETGSEDLDAYGTWSEVPDVGRVWTPQQGPDWAPYRDGNWVYEPYWGWTWVGGEPWGWAPYHYGRWAVYGGRWGWWPGPVSVGYYPVWAPAYVSFFGYGPGFGVGFGWFPCGPGDFLFPWWGGFGFGFGFAHPWGFRGGFGGRGWGPLLRNDRFSNLHNFESNARVRGGFSGLAGDRFGRGGGARPTAVNPGAFRGGRIMTGNLPVVPSRESLSASGKFQSPGAGGARAGAAKSFFGKSASAARPASFSQTASRLQNSIQKDGHFSPVTSENRGGAAGGAAGKFGGSASPASGARVVGSGRPETNGNTGVNRGGANNDRPPTGVGARGTGSTGATPNEGFGSRSPNTGNPGGAARPSTQSDTRPSGAGSSGTWRSFGSPSGSGAGRSTASPNGGYRPPLTMNKPIVTQRPGSIYGGAAGRPGSSPTSRPPSYPSGGARPGYSAPSRPTYSAPSRPTYSAPSRPSYSAPRQSAPASRPPSGGGSHAPSGGSHGGSAPHSSGGGGGHSGGGGGGHSRR
jgi:hypothetical protein